MDRPPVAMVMTPPATGLPDARQLLEIRVQHAQARGRVGVHLEAGRLRLQWVT
jgi:hypothetical protein